MDDWLRVVSILRILSSFNSPCKLESGRDGRTDRQVPDEDASPCTLRNIGNSVVVMIRLLAPFDPKAPKQSVNTSTPRRPNSYLFPTQPACIISPPDPFARMHVSERCTHLTASLSSPACSPMSTCCNGHLLILFLCASSQLIYLSPKQSSPSCK